MCVGHQLCKLMRFWVPLTRSHKHVARMSPATLWIPTFEKDTYRLIPLETQLGTIITLLTFNIISTSFHHFNIFQWVVSKCLMSLCTSWEDLQLRAQQARVHLWHPVTSDICQTCKLSKVEAARRAAAEVGDGRSFFFTAGIFDDFWRFLDHLCQICAIRFGIFSQSQWWPLWSDRWPVELQVLQELWRRP